MRWLIALRLCLVIFSGAMMSYYIAIGQPSTLRWVEAAAPVSDPIKLSPVSDVGLTYSTSNKILVTSANIGPYPKTGVTLQTFPLYNGCPDQWPADNQDEQQEMYQACVRQWLTMTTEHLKMLEVDVFRVPFGAEAANELIGPDLLKPIAERPPFHGRHFLGDTPMIGWPEADHLRQATGAEVMWVLNVRGCVLGVCGTGTLERGRQVVQALKGKVRYYELGSEDYRPLLVNDYRERLNQFGGMIQAEDPEADYAAVLLDSFVWATAWSHGWKNVISNTVGPHRLQRHLFFPTGDRLTFRRQEAQFSFPLIVTQTGMHTFTLTLEDANPATDTLVTTEAGPLTWNGVGFSGFLTQGAHTVTITSLTETPFKLRFVFDLITPNGERQETRSILEGRAGWGLYMAGAHSIGPDMIPQDIGSRRVWVSEIAEHAVSPASESDGRSGHRWLDALAYASGFMRAASDPRVEIILGHTLYEVGWNGMVGGVGRVPWQAWESIEANINPKPRPKFWVHQQIARHIKRGQQLAVSMPFSCQIDPLPEPCTHLTDAVQMGYSGRISLTMPLLECWGSDLALKRSLLCLNRSYDQSFTFPVEFSGIESITAQMTLLTGMPGDHNEGSRPMIEPQSRAVSLDQVEFPPRSLVRLVVDTAKSRIYLPVILRFAD